jgi:hypothetical protein
MYLYEQLESRVRFYVYMGLLFVAYIHTLNCYCLYLGEINEKKYFQNNITKFWFDRQNIFPHMSGLLCGKPFVDPPPKVIISYYQALFLHCGKYDIEREEITITRFLNLPSYLIERKR